MPDPTERTAGGTSGQRAAAHFVLPALALGVLAAVAVWPVLGNRFVSLDEPFLTHNPRVRDGLVGPAVQEAFRMTAPGAYRPVARLAYLVEVTLFGLDPFGHHLVSLLLHALNAAMLFFLLRSYTGAAARSFAVASLFAVHPLQVESVAWASALGHLIGTMLCLVTLWLYRRYAQAPSRARMAAVGAVYAAGLLAEPLLLIALPFLMLVLDDWPLRRASRMGPLVREKAALFALAALALVAYASSGTHGLLLTDAESLTPAARVAHTALAYAYTLGHLFWTRNLSFFYAYPVLGWPPWRVWVAALLLAAVTWICLRNLRHRPYLAVGWAWYVVALLPCAFSIAGGSPWMSDRFATVPMIGILVAVVWTVADSARGPALRASAAACAALVVVALTLQAQSGAARWHDDETLYGRALQIAPGNYIAHVELARHYRRDHRDGDAREQYAAAQRIRPGLAHAYVRRGAAAEKAGDAEGARDAFDTAARLDPALQSARYHLARAGRSLGDSDSAFSNYVAALKLDPNDARSLNGLGEILLARGQAADAIDLFREATAIDPQQARFVFNLGRALQAQGMPDEARTNYERALGLDPADAGVRAALDELNGKSVAP